MYMDLHVSCCEAEGNGEGKGMGKNWGKIWLFRSGHYVLDKVISSKCSFLISSLSQVANILLVGILKVSTIIIFFCRLFC